MGLVFDLEISRLYLSSKEKRESEKDSRFAFFIGMPISSIEEWAEREAE